MTDAIVLFLAVTSLFLVGVGLVTIAEWIARRLGVDWSEEGNSAPYRGRFW